MVVTMIAMGMVQVVIDEVVDVVAVRHRLVPAIGSVSVCDLVAAALVIGRAAFRILCSDLQDMLLNQGGARLPHRMMEVTVMKIIDMTAVFDADMAAV
jgi:hypothetical protein